MDSCTLEDIMAMVIMKFDKCAGKDADKGTLSQDELCELAIKEFPTLCSSKKKDEILKGIIGKMDSNNDKKVNFEEFMCFLACLAMALKQISQK